MPGAPPPLGAPEGTGQGSVSPKAVPPTLLRGAGQRLEPPVPGGLEGAGQCREPPVPPSPGQDPPSPSPGAHRGPGQAPLPSPGGARSLTAQVEPLRVGAQHAHHGRALHAGERQRRSQPGTPAPAPLTAAPRVPPYPRNPLVSLQSPRVPAVPLCPPRVPSRLLQVLFQRPLHRPAPPLPPRPGQRHHPRDPRDGGSAGPKALGARSAPRGRPKIRAHPGPCCGAAASPRPVPGSGGTRSTPAPPNQLFLGVFSRRARSAVAIFEGFSYSHLCRRTP